MNSSRLEIFKPRSDRTLREFNTLVFEKIENILLRVNILRVFYEFAQTQRVHF